MSDLYDTDIALWSEHQANLLRRRAAGQPVNDTDLDWPNIADQIEAWGRSERPDLIKLQASSTPDANEPKGFLKQLGGNLLIPILVGLGTGLGTNYFQAKENFEVWQSEHKAESASKLAGRGGRLGRYSVSPSISGSPAG